MEKNYITQQNSLWSLSVDFHFNTRTHMTVSLADVEGKERKKIFMSRETEENSRSCTNASCDHGLEKRQFLQNFPFIMNSQAHKTLCWHTQPGCFRVLVKQTGPTGCMCSVTVTGCGSLAEMLVISPATGHDAVTMPTVVKGAGW